MTHEKRIAICNLLAAAKFALENQCHKRSRTAVALREAIDGYEQAAEEDHALTLEQIRAAGLL